MKRNTLLFSGIVIALLAVLITFLAINASNNPSGYTVKTSDKPIKIGVILPLSGNAARYGEASQRGIEIARDEISKKFPDLKFDIYYGDSAYLPQQGVSSYRQLKNINDIDAVITAASQVSLAIAPLTLEDNILQMAIFSSAKKYSTPDDLLFRITAKNTIEANAMAEFIKNKKYKKIGIICLNNDFGVSLKDSLKEQLIKVDAPAEVVLEEAFLLDAADFRTILTKMRDKDPDGIFMVGTAGHYAEVLKQAKELGIETQFLAMHSAENPVLIEKAGDLANNLVYTYAFDATSQAQEVKSFVDAFELKYGKLPDSYAAEGYESFKLVALAFIECDKDYVCIEEYLEGLDNYESVFGELSFDNNGDVYYEFFMKTVRDGEFVVLE